MEKTSGIDLISAFLDESGYNLLHPLLAKQRALDPGEYTWWGTAHIRLFPLHRKNKITFTVAGTILEAQIDMQSRSFPGAQRPIGLPFYKNIDLAKPWALEQLKSLI